jgi:hypothetical protein
MATEAKNSEQIRVPFRNLADTDFRAGLTTDPDSLLAVLNTIEQSVAAGFRPKTHFKSVCRVRKLFH